MHTTGSSCATAMVFVHDLEVWSNSTSLVAPASDYTQELVALQAGGYFDISSMKKPH